MKHFEYLIVLNGQVTAYWACSLVFDAIVISSCNPSALIYLNEEHKEMLSVESFSKRLHLIGVICMSVFGDLWFATVHQPFKVQFALHLWPLVNKRLCSSDHPDFNTYNNMCYSGVRKISNSIHCRSNHLTNMVNVRLCCFM